MADTTKPQNTVIIVEENPFVDNDASAKIQSNFDDLLEAGRSGNTKNGALQTLAKGGNSLASIIIGAAIGIIAPILEVYIGFTYADECPINPKIPMYLRWAGILGIIVVILNLVRGYLTSKATKSASNAAASGSDATVKIDTNTKLFGLFSIVVTCISLFLLCWFIAGCIWIFGVWSDVQYAPPTHPDFCHKTLYRFAYILICIPIVLLVVCCCLPLCVGVVAMSALRK